MAAVILNLNLALKLTVLSFLKELALFFPADQSFPPCWAKQTLKEELHSHEQSFTEAHLPCFSANS